MHTGVGLRVGAGGELVGVGWRAPGTKSKHHVQIIPGADLTLTMLSWSGLT